MHPHLTDRAVHLPPAPRRPRGGWSQGLVAALLLACASCSLTLDSNANQCETDEDCVQFGTYPVCQEGLCVPSGLGPPGCFRGEPSSEEQYRNQCTTSQCIPFDNCARLGLCNGEALPPLVPKQ